MSTRDRDIGLAETVIAPPQKRPVWPIIVAAVVLIGGGVGIALYATREKPKSDGVVKAPVVIDAAPTAPPIVVVASTTEELLIAERAALAKADEATLAQLLAPDAFVIGFDAGDIATKGPAGAGMIARMLGGPTTIEVRTSTTGRNRDVAWIIDDLQIGKRRVMSSQLAWKDGGVWRVAAWHIAELLGNQRAGELAKAGELPVPAEIADQFDDDHQVHDEFGKAFVSFSAFADAFSDRPDALDVGSAPGELKLSGAVIKKHFKNHTATIKIRDGIAAGRVSDTIGWGAANVDFSSSIGGTQTFRVFAVLARESAGWRLVLAQWSNAGPFPTTSSTPAAGSASH